MTNQTRRARPAVVVALVLLAITPAIAAEQPRPTTGEASLVLSSSSARAKSLFRDAWVDSQNVWPERARLTIARSIEEDPQFALAQVFQALISTAGGREREQAITGIMAQMGSTSVPEVLLATYWREVAGGRGAAAAPVLRALAELAPADADIAWMHNGLLRAGQPPARQAGLIREHLARFPGQAAALNTLAYALHSAGETEAGLQAALEQVKQLPQHRNALDTLADFYILLRRPAEAAATVQRELEVDPDFAGAFMKRGAIVLMADGPAKARPEFERGLDRFTAPATKLAFINWLAATDVYAANGSAALDELARAITMAESAGLPAAAAAAHDRAAIVEAFLGKPENVRGHLAAGASGTPPALHFAMAALATARIGDLASARTALARYQTMVAAVDSLQHSIAAYIALCDNDLAGAEHALKVASPVDLLAKAVRADLAGRRGQSAERARLQQDVMTSNPKMDGNPPPDYVKLVARLHLSR